ncbi:MAG: sigma-70 family RNA polymerase sigma factor, partial [Candidatus Paceibacterota bacterium]
MELVTQLQNGEKSAFEELFKRYSTKAYNLAYRITRKEEDAEEIIQETFINVFSKINSFQGKSAFSSWLYRITFNTALMKLRKRKKHLTLPLEINSNSEDSFVVEYCSPEEHHRCNVFPIKHEMRGHLEQAVNSLPTEYRS